MWKTNGLGGHGAFRTNIWIFKHDRDVEAQFFNSGLYGGPGKGFEPSQIDLAILFNDTPLNPSGYRHIHLPYYFQKIATQKEKAEIESEKTTILFIPGVTGGSAYVVQRPFLFGTQIFVLIQSAGGYFVYRFQNGRIDDVCYFASSSDLMILHDHGWALKRSKQ